MKNDPNNHPITWFRREDDHDTLVLSPDFQRNFVWEDEQSAYLIDTILQGLPIPEIYLRTKTSSDGETVHEVVDGQQRIRSILNFSANDLQLVGNDISGKWTGKYLDDLTKREKAKFWEYRIVVREIGSASDGEVRDVFRRLNINSFVLTDQELRHAKYTGQFLKLVEDLADDDWLLTRRVVTLKQVRRMSDVEFVSELIVGILAGPQDKKNSLEDYYRDYNDEFAEERYCRRVYNQTREMLDDVLGIDCIKTWRSKSEFYTLFLSFADLCIRKTKLSDRQRMEIVQTLQRFRKQVDQAKKMDNETVYSKAVHRYADAVTRAASDLSRRVTRQKVLDARIRRAIKS